MLSVNLLPGADSAASAIQAEKVRMEVISQNIANANTTSTPQGGPYQRQVVRFETVMKNQFDAANAVQQVQVAGIEADNRPHRLIYQPGHPDADPESGIITKSVYLLGILGAVFHFSNGINTFCMTWGIALTPVSQKRILILSIFIFLILFTSSLYALSFIW